MDWKIIAVCVFAIVASYLIVSMPAAEAAPVTITWSGGNTQATYNPRTYVSESITADPTSGAIRVQVSNTTPGMVVDLVNIYRCQDKTPSACSSQVTPNSTTGNTNVVYNWNDASDASGTKANIMVLVHVSGTSGSVWLSFWSNGNKNGQNYLMVAGDIDSITITTNSSANANTIANFINSNGMIPMSISKVLSVVFSSAFGIAGFYDLESPSPPSIATQTYTTGSTLNNINSNYVFIFPYTGSYVLNGMTFSKITNYVCGDGTCSSALGETSGNCCRDCGTPTGFYCDSSGSVRQLSTISLSGPPTSTLTVTNCNIANTVPVSFTINNMPTGTTINSATYTLNGTSTPYTSICSAVGGSVFLCNVTAPALPGCSGNDYLLSPNSMTFNIRFSNASSYITKAISASFPDISVGSWTCGQNGCETSLGESSANCCTDCGCTGIQYCDYIGQPEAAYCRNTLTSTNLQFVSAAPLNFYTHDSVNGNNVNVNLQITNKPASMTPNPPSTCSVDDCVMNNGGLPCTASCSISCSQTTSNDPNVYNSSCVLNFKIAGYDPVNNYTVSTSVSHSITYNNGVGGTISTTLGVSVPPISVGSHWKGDGRCDTDESSAIVCFDCPCDTGQYCNSVNRGVYNAGDVCSPMSDANIIIDSISKTAFDDSGYSYAIDVEAHTSGKPNGFSLAYSCAFNNSIGAPACSLSCSSNQTASNYGINCTIIVPSMNYKTSPFYDSTTKKITLPHNSILITSAFNNGSSSTTVNQNFTIPDISVGVIPHCGDGICSDDIGETTANCCIDCGCSATKFCLPEASAPNGNCVNTNDIRLVFNGTTPKNVTCTIQQMKGNCTFISATSISAYIINQPRGASINSVWFTERNVSRQAFCFQNVSNYTCGVVLDDLDNSTAINTRLNGTLNITISYRENGTQRLQSLTSNFNIDVTRVKSDYVLTCEKQLKSLADQESSLQDDKDTLEMVIIALGALAAAAWIAYAVSCIDGCNPMLLKLAWCLTCVAAIAASTIMPMLNSISQKLDSVKAQKKVMCNTNSASGLGSSNGDTADMSDMMMTIGLAIVSLVVCLICAAQLFGGGAGGASGASGSSSGGGAAAGGSAATPALPPGVILIPPATPPPTPPPIYV